MPDAMTLAVGSDVECNGVSAVRPSLSRGMGSTKLDEADVRLLGGWLDHAGTSGIDAVLDLAVRPWNIVGADAILGVFESDKNQASWLIVRGVSGWTVARCSDGFVSDVSICLADILSLIDADVRA